MGVRNPDGPGPTAARRVKKAVRLDASCKVQIGKVVRSGVAVLTPEELRFTSTDFNSYVTVSTADGAPRRVNGRMAASRASGLGITPKMDVLGKPAVVVQ